MGEDEWLEFIDFLVYYLAESSWLSQQRLDELTDLLERGGSELTVGDRAGGRGLVKRVPEGVAEATRHIMDSNTSAGALLAEAWHATYSRNPDPGKAYEKAMKVVEEGGVAVVTPTDLNSTLGKMIAVMRSQGDWRLSLASVAATVPVQMAEVIWQGQVSRPRGNGYRKPSAEEDESAVLLAIPLVQWFSSGVVARRSQLYLLQSPASSDLMDPLTCGLEASLHPQTKPQLAYWYWAAGYLYLISDIKELGQKSTKETR